MSQQTIKQRARRTARDMADRWRRQREERENRVIDLTERVMVANGERDAAGAETEQRAGEALQTLTEREGLSPSDARTPVHLRRQTCTERNESLPRVQGPACSIILFGSAPRAAQGRPAQSAQPG